MPFIEIKESENFDLALRKFKRQCERAGVITNARKKEFYEKPTSVRRRKKITSKRRIYKRTQQTRSLL